jgi:hypothetical protein
MPRIELIPTTHDVPFAVDVCVDCAELFVEGEYTPRELNDYLLHKVGNKYMDHFSYDAEMKTCDICHGPLASEDD